MRNLLVIYLLSLLFITPANSQLQFVKHIVEDSLKKDTIYYDGAPSSLGSSTAIVTLRAQGAQGQRNGLNIMLVCDFSKTMADTASDTAARKVHLMFNAVRRFIDNYLTDNDGLAMMRFKYNFQMIPEKERPYYYDNNCKCYKSRAPLTGATAPYPDSSYADTVYFIPASLRGPDGLRGHVDTINLGQWGQAMACQSSYGIERAWWTFSHQVTLHMDGSYGRYLPDGITWVDTVAVIPSTTNLPYGLWDWRLIGSSGGNAWEGDGTSLYYSLWQAIRYSLAHNDKGTAPVIIFLTDGADESSGSAFGSYSDPQFPLPSYFQGLSGATSFDTVRSRFERYFFESVQEQVALYTIILDTLPQPDYSTLYKISSYNNKYYGAKGRWFKARGSDLDSIYNRIGEGVREKVARPISTNPLFIEEINTTAGLKLDSYWPGTENTVVFDSIVQAADQASGNTLLKFYLNSARGMNAEDIFDYKYKISAYLSTPSLTPQAIAVNPDSLLSRAYYLNTNGATVSQSFNKDTIWVLSQVVGLALSTQSNSLNTSGISSARLLSYERGVTIYDTSLTVYTLLGLKASTPTPSYINVNSSWAFSPLAWIDDGSRTISLSSAPSVKPYVVVGFDSSGANDKTYNLTAACPNPQQLGQTLTATLSYNAFLGKSSDYIDSIAIAVGVDSARGISSQELVPWEKNMPLPLPLQLFALGRSHQTGLFSSKLAVHWNVVSGFDNYYQDIRAIVSALPDTVPSLSVPITVDLGNSARQSDTGVIQISYEYDLGSQHYVKTFSITIMIVDGTVNLVPNRVAIFTSDKYIPNQFNSAKIESLFVNYFDTLHTVALAANDTAITLYSLLFSVNGADVQFMGLDSLSNWGVANGISGLGFTETAKNQLYYKNHFAPRTDEVTVTSSVGDGKRLSVIWHYGSKRYLSLESRPATLNDNLAGVPSPTPYLLLSKDVNADSVYAVIRDEYGNAVSYDGTLQWSVPTAGYSSYIRFDSTGNPCRVRKDSTVNANRIFSLVATVPTSSVIGGVTLASALKDTVNIHMSASGYDSMMIRVAVGRTLHDTLKLDFTNDVDVSSSRVLSCRANAPEDSLLQFTAYVHDPSYSGNYPLGWIPVTNAFWHYVNKSPFKSSDSGTTTNQSVKIIRPAYPISLDTMVAEWTTGSKTFRDTIRFRVLAGYPARVIVTPLTNLTAGTAVPFSITLLDANGDTVKDASLYPSKLNFYAGDTSLEARGSGAWQSGFYPNAPTEIALSFNNGVSSDSILCTRAGSAWFSFEVTLAGLGTIQITDSFTVSAGVPASMRLVRYSGSTTLNLTTDTLYSVSGGSGTRTQEYYVAELFDAYQNRITQADVLSRVSWRAEGLSMSQDNFRPANNTLTYIARGLTQSANGLVICNLLPSLADTLRLAILAPIMVTQISTHEWFPGQSSSSGLTTNDVLAILKSNNQYISFDTTIAFLADSVGYKTYLDGYLDYLEVAFSTPVYLTPTTIVSILAEHGDLDNDTVTVWKGPFSKSTGNADFYALVPCDGKADLPSDSTHTRYRIWLKPSWRFKDITGKSPNPACLETGFLPVLTFDNTVISRLNGKGVVVGGGALYHTSTSVIADSAAPVISKILYVDNACSENDKRDYAEVYFSEPVRQFTVFESDFRKLVPFALRSLAAPVQIDSLFLADTAIVDSLVSIDGDFGSSDARERWNFIANNGVMMYCRLRLSNTSQATAKISTAGVEIRLAASSQSSRWCVFDKSMNTGNLKQNRWVLIQSAKPKNEVVCQVSQTTLSNLTDAKIFNWTPDNKPLFPWWGATVTNPFFGDTSNFPGDKRFVFAVYVFDLLGNLVASPDKNPCLKVELTYNELFSVSNLPGAKRTASLGSDYLISKAAQGSPCKVLPAWNGTNNKGRIVAPGGYIVKFIIDNQYSGSEETTLKLIMTNGK